MADVKRLTSTMNLDATEILTNLQLVSGERQARAADAGLGLRVRLVKAYQHLRFQHTYADLLQQPRWAKAARFFLDDLYGPSDFSARDEQFARVVPGLVRLFPRDIVKTVLALSRLHSLSESLDTAMGRALPHGIEALTAPVYVDAWQHVGAPADRHRQIDLMLDVGRALDKYTGNPLLRHSLRVMRAPAHAAGLGALQSFLETGFDTFREMRGADFFLQTIARRERVLADALFLPAGETSSTAAMSDLPVSVSMGAAPA